MDIKSFLKATSKAGIINRLNRVDEQLDRMEKENERQHLETRALIKISFTELDGRSLSLSHK